MNAKQLIILTTSLWLFLSGSTRETFGQTYEVLVKQAFSLYKEKSYRKSNEVYQQAFKLEKKNSDDLYNAARSAALAGDKKKAFEYLNLALKNGWMNINSLKFDPDLEALRSSKKWSAFVDKMQIKIDSLGATYDKPLQKELLAILSADVTIRREYEQTIKKIGYKNQTRDSLVKVMWHTDSSNLVRVSKILAEHGWVSQDKVGPIAGQALFVTIQHSDLKTQQKYLPMMREAVKKGDAYAKDLARLEDRIAVREGKKQIYGTQFLPYQNDRDRYFIAPLEDPDNVDKRRAEVGLGPIAKSARHMGIQWNVEEYKKQLPELEQIANKILQEEKKN